MARYTTKRTNSQRHKSRAGWVVQTATPLVFASPLPTHFLRVAVSLSSPPPSSVLQVEYTCEYHEESKGNIPAWAVSWAMDKCVDSMVNGAPCPCSLSLSLPTSLSPPPTDADLIPCVFFLRDLQARGLAQVIALLPLCCINLKQRARSRAHSLSLLLIKPCVRAQRGNKMRCNTMANLPPEVYTPQDPSLDTRVYVSSSGCISVLETGPETRHTQPPQCWSVFDVSV